jgi:hypothetical protein
MSVKREKCFKEIPIKQLVFGVISFVPFANKLYKRVIGESSYSNSNSRFCYSMWLRILVTMHESKLETRLTNIAEIGNSSSLGVGLAALLTGVETYTSLEVIKSGNIVKNLKMFEELIKLFRAKEDIPDDKVFSRINLQLADYKFPTNILTDKRMSVLLSEERLNNIRNSIQNIGQNNNTDIISAYIPWELSINHLVESMDLIISRAVMEHIDDYEDIYYKLNLCLKANGIMLHDVEYHHHGIGRHWNSHWEYSSFIWNLIKGKRLFITNRTTHSMQCESLKRTGFQILLEKRIIRTTRIQSKCLTKEFRDISDIDLNTYGGWFLVSKHGVKSR